MAAPEVIPPELSAFLRRHVHSVWALELLLFLRKNAQRSYGVPELATELRASDPLVAGIIPQFLKDGLAVETKTAHFAYRPATPELSALADRLELVYRDNPVSVVREIALAPNPQIQSFADAFKFRKE